MPNIRTDLIDAVIVQDVQKARDILQQQNPKINNRCEYDAYTALTLAVFKNNCMLIKLLLSNPDINVNKPYIYSTYNISPLSIAVEEDSSNMVGLLLAKDGIEVIARDHNGYTPLMRAASIGNKEIVRALLEKNSINPNATVSSFGSYTASGLAKYYNHHDIAKMIDEHPNTENAKPKGTINIALQDCFYSATAAFIIAISSSALILATVSASKIAMIILLSTAPISYIATLAFIEFKLIEHSQKNMLGATSNTAIAVPAANMVSELPQPSAPDANGKEVTKLHPIDSIISNSGQYIN